MIQANLLQKIGWPIVWMFDILSNIFYQFRVYRNTLTALVDLLIVLLGIGVVLVTPIIMPENMLMLRIGWLLTYGLGFLLFGITYPKPRSERLTLDVIQAVILGSWVSVSMALLHL